MQKAKTNDEFYAWVAKWYRVPALSEPAAAIALRVVARRGENGELTRTTEPAPPNVCMNLQALADRPFWLTEHFVQTAISGSDSALSWLAGGESARVNAQLKLDNTTPRKNEGEIPDLVLVVGENIRLVELKIDGQGNAGPQLERQLQALCKDYPFLNPADAKLVALDVKPTRAPKQVVSLTWCLARDPEISSDLYLLFGSLVGAPGKMATTASARAHGEILELPSCPFKVAVSRRRTLAATGEVRVITVRVWFASKAEAERQVAGTQPFFRRPGQIMERGEEWMKRVVHHLWGHGVQADLTAIGWEVFNKMGSNGAAHKPDLLVHFADDRSKESLDRIKRTVASWTWPDTTTW